MLLFLLPIFWVAAAKPLQRTRSAVLPRQVSMTRLRDIVPIRLGDAGPEVLVGLRGHKDDKSNRLSAVELIDTQRGTSETLIQLEDPDQFISSVSRDGFVWIGNCQRDQFGKRFSAVRLPLLAGATPHAPPKQNLEKPHYTVSSPTSDRHVSHVSLRGRDIDIPGSVGFVRARADGGLMVFSKLPFRDVVFSLSGCGCCEEVYSELRLQPGYLGQDMVPPSLRALVRFSATCREASPSQKHKRRCDSVIQPALAFVVAAIADYSCTLCKADGDFLARYRFVE